MKERTGMIKCSYMYYTQPRNMKSTSEVFELVGAGEFTDGHDIRINGLATIKFGSSLCTHLALHPFTKTDRRIEL